MGRQPPPPKKWQCKYKTSKGWMDLYTNGGKKYFDLNYVELREEIERQKIQNGRSYQGLLALWHHSNIFIVFCLSKKTTPEKNNRLLTVVCIGQWSNDTQTASYWVTHCECNFWSSSHIHILPAVGAKIAQKWCVPSSLDSENRQFKEWSEKCAFILPPTSTRPMCLI